MSLAVHVVEHGAPHPLLQELVAHVVGAEVARVVERDAPVLVVHVHVCV